MPSLIYGRVLVVSLVLNPYVGRHCLHGGGGVDDGAVQDCIMGSGGIGASVGEYVRLSVALQVFPEASSVKEPSKFGRLRFIPALVARRGVHEMRGDPLAAEMVRGTVLNELCNAVFFNLWRRSEGRPSPIGVGRGGGPLGSLHR